MRIAVPDLISNSYFPAVAAVDLGIARQEGLDIELELMFPVTKTMQALRDGELDFVAGSAHSTLTAFPQWKGAKLLVALAQYMYWFLVVRSDLELNQQNLDVLKGLRIGAAPGVDLGLKCLLTASGIDPDKELEIGPVMDAGSNNLSFGVTAAKALEDGKIDGFWANGMATEVAVRSGVGKVLLDVRRGDGPDEARFYTFPALVTSDAVIAKHKDAVEAMIRAIVKTQVLLKQDPSQATVVGKRLFPEHESELIADLIKRDLPFYDPEISKETVERMNNFALSVKLLNEGVAYEDIVAQEFTPLWSQA